MNYSDPWQIERDGLRREQEAMRTITNKNACIRTFMHYTDKDAKEVITVFGAKREGLFYNYDDRLVASEGSYRWRDGLKLAGKELGIETSTQQTARFFEIALSHFHKTDVDLQHILLGCNQSNGFCYLVFGYTYDENAG